MREEASMSSGSSERTMQRAEPGMMRCVRAAVLSAIVVSALLGCALLLSDAWPHIPAF